MFLPKLPKPRLPQFQAYIRRTLFAEKNNLKFLEVQNVQTKKPPKGKFVTRDF